MIFIILIVGVLVGAVVVAYWDNPEDDWDEKN